MRLILSRNKVKKKKKPLGFHAFLPCHLPCFILFPLFEQIVGAAQLHRLNTNVWGFDSLFREIQRRDNTMQKELVRNWSASLYFILLFSLFFRFSLKEFLWPSVFLMFPSWKTKPTSSTPSSLSCCPSSCPEEETLRTNRTTQIAHQESSQFGIRKWREWFFFFSNAVSLPCNFQDL